MIKEGLNDLYWECYEAKDGSMVGVFTQVLGFLSLMKGCGVNFYRTWSNTENNTDLNKSTLWESGGKIHFYDYSANYTKTLGCSNRSIDYHPFLNIFMQKIGGETSGKIELSLESGRKAFWVDWDDNYIADIKTLVCCPECKAQKRVDEKLAAKRLYSVLEIAHATIEADGQITIRKMLKRWCELKNEGAVG